MGRGRGFVVPVGCGKANIVCIRANVALLAAKQAKGVAQLEGAAHRFGQI